MQNHWWQVTLYVTARGLGTSPMPVGSRSLEVDFDFLDHQLVARASDGQTATMALEPMTVETFYGRYLDAARVAVGRRRASGRCRASCRTRCRSPTIASTLPTIVMR